MDDEHEHEQESETPEAAAQAPPAAGLTPDELAAVRELALRAHPDAVPELVGGESLAALLASLEPARAAYRRIAETAAATAATARGEAAPVVPAGNAPRLVTDPDLLPATEKIRRGLEASRQ